jgi:hypothetical protein
MVFEELLFKSYVSVSIESIELSSLDCCNLFTQQRSDNEKAKAAFYIALAFFV